MNSAVLDLFADFAASGPLVPPDDLIPTLHALTRLAALGRAPVDRDGYSREITFVAGEEGPGRLIGQFVGLLFGLEAIGCDRPLALDVVRRVGFDCIPRARGAMILELLTREEEATTKALASSLGTPTKSAYRTLEELLVYGLANRHAREDRANEEGKDGRADGWSASPLLRELHAASRTAIPTADRLETETSGRAHSPNSSNPRLDDFSVLNRIPADARPGA